MIQSLTRKVFMQLLLFWEADGGWVFWRYFDWGKNAFVKVGQADWRLSENILNILPSTKEVWNGLPFWFNLLLFWNQSNPNGPYLYW